MTAYLSKMNRRVRIARARERLFEIFISSLPDLRGWVVGGITVVIIALMLVIGSWD